MSRRRVGIWGVFGRGNYGNEATLQAILAHLDSGRFEPVILTEAPDEAARLHGIRAVSLGRPAPNSTGIPMLRLLQTAANRLGFLAGTLRFVRTLDVVVVGGSGGLEGSGTGTFGTLYEIWCCSIASRLFGKPFVLLNVGSEAPTGRIGRSMLRTAARLATYRAFRDEASRARVVEAGVAAAATDRVATDIVFSLDPDLASHRDARTVILGVMDYWGTDASVAASVHDSYRDRCIELAAILRDRGWRVRLVGGDDDDLAMARIVSAATGIPGGDIIEARTTQELTAVLSTASVVAATRYHTLVMSLMSQTPAISIGYAEKCRSILEQLGFDGRHRHARSFVPVEVADLIDRVAGGPDSSPRIARAVAQARRILEQQWPEVVDALEAPRTRRASRAAAASERAGAQAS